MWSRSHAPWEETAARPVDDTRDSIEQAESRRIQDILKQNGALRARSSSSGHEPPRFDDVDRRPSLRWSPPKRRKTVVQVVSSTDFGWARNYVPERQIERRVGGRSSEQAIAKPARELVSARKGESCNKPRRVIGEKFWELDEYDCRICLEKISRTLVSLVTPCMHKFCFNCIKKWTKTKRTCAICNSTVDSICYAIVSASEFKEILLDGDSGSRDSDQQSVPSSSKRKK